MHVNSKVREVHIGSGGGDVTVAISHDAAVEMRVRGAAAVLGAVSGSGSSSNDAGGRGMLFTVLLVFCRVLNFTWSTMTAMLGVDLTQLPDCLSTPSELPDCLSTPSGLTDFPSANVAQALLSTSSRLVRRSHSGNPREGKVGRNPGKCRSPQLKCLRSVS